MGGMKIIPNISLATSREMTISRLKTSLTRTIITIITKKAKTVKYFTFSVIILITVSTMLNDLIMVISCEVAI